MLALSRKTGESIVIGNDVEITILEVKGNQVKVGIKAPKSVPVYRKEIYEQIQADNQEVISQNATPAMLEQLLGKK